MSCENDFFFSHRSSYLPAVIDNSIAQKKIHTRYIRSHHTQHGVRGYEVLSPRSYRLMIATILQGHPWLPGGQGDYPLCWPPRGWLGGTTHLGVSAHSHPTKRFTCCGTIVPQVSQLYIRWTGYPKNIDRLFVFSRHRIDNSTYEPTPPLIVTNLQHFCPPRTRQAISLDSVCYSSVYTKK